MPGRLAVLLAGLLVLGATAAAPTSTWGQVHIDQVQSTTAQIEDASQGQVVVSVGENAETVKRGDVLGLVPGTTPPLQSVAGNSSVVFQRGSSNDASATQRGRNNEASTTQQGGQNSVSIVQTGLGTGGADDFRPPPFSSFPDVPSDAAFDHAQGVPFRGGGGPIRGEDNLAVSVQQGTGNDTNVEQRGRDNVAGLRLDGAYNEANLAQLGVGNRYLLEYTGDDLTLNVAQIGRKNRLTQIGQGRKPFDVTMRGNGIRMIIRHGGP